MASFHVLHLNQKGDQAQVLFHLSVPDQNNAVGVNYRTALSQWRPQTAQYPALLDQTEIDAIAAGSVYEHSETVHFSADATNTQKWTAIRDRYNELNTEIKNAVLAQIEFWGYEEVI